MMSMSRSDRSVQYILQNFIWEDSFLQLSSGFQVSQKLDNMLGHGGGDGQVSSGGLESVLIGNPVDGVSYSFQFVGVRSARNASDFFGLVADQLLLSLFLDGDTISGLVAVPSQQKNEISHRGAESVDVEGMLEWIVTYL